VNRPPWAPEEVDLNRPNPARLYDYLLGGSHNFPVDREAANAMLSAAPEMADAARANRAFLTRAVRTVAEAGIDQFLDLGSGIPTAGNVHEVAQRSNTAARVVYVDIDPVAVAHARAIVAGDERVGVVKADLRQLDTVFTDAEADRLLDRDRPFAALLVSVLHFLTDDDAAEVMRRLRELLPAGSYVVLSHGTSEYDPNRESDAVAVKTVYSRTATPVQLRTTEQVGALLTGFDLLEPGLVPLQRWRPDDADTLKEENFVGAVGKKA
jgi:SAM-dependent methyltransferase